MKMTSLGPYFVKKSNCISFVSTYSFTNLSVIHSESDQISESHSFLSKASPFSLQQSIIVLGSHAARITTTYKDLDYQVCYQLNLTFTISDTNPDVPEYLPQNICIIPWKLHVQKLLVITFLNCVFTFIT